MGQQEQVAHTGSYLKDLYLSLKTLDLFAIEYRSGWIGSVEHFRFIRAMPRRSLL